MSTALNVTLANSALGVLVCLVSATVAVGDVFTPPREPTRPRSDILMPLTNLVLPGLDQWWEGQYPYGAAYSGIWLGGQTYAVTVAARNDLDGQIRKQRDAAEGRGDDRSDVSLDEKDVTVRKYLLGQLVAQGASGFSTWHSFRTAAASRRELGQYGFLPADEGPVELMLAPFDPSHLRESTTWVPLVVGSALAALTLSAEEPSGYERTAFTGADAFFTSAYSLNAGTHEEALFRGYVMPVMAEYTGSPFLANLGQSLLFAAAHLGHNPRPLPQLFLGFHLGSVTQRRGWSLAESVFIHTWWDVIAFAVAYHYKQVERSSFDRPEFSVTPVLWLPPLFTVF